MATQQLTVFEVKEFADKLEAFGQQLSPKEQAVFGEILRRAAASDEDVEGHALLVDPSQVLHHAPALLHLKTQAWYGMHGYIHALVAHVAGVGHGVPPPHPHNSPQ